MEVLRRGKVPSEKEVLELGEAVALVYGTPRAAFLLSRLSEQAEVLRDWLFISDKPKRIIFLHRLLLACPPLLLHPKEFAWFFQDYFRLLRERKFNVEIDRDYWESLDGLRRAERKGRPPEKTRDLRRYWMVESLTNPSKEKMPFVKKLSKTQAVEKVAEWEGTLDGDIQGIWTSLRNVKGRLAELIEALKDASQITLVHQKNKAGPRKRLRR